MLQNTSVTASTVSEALMEIQQGGGVKLPPTQIRVNEYGEGTSYEPEICSCIAGVSKIFLIKLIKNYNLKWKLGEAKIPSNYTFYKLRKPI